MITWAPKENCRPYFFNYSLMPIHQHSIINTAILYVKHSYPAFKQSQTMLQMISLNWVMYKMVPIKSTRPYELINYTKLDDLPT